MDVLENINQKRARLIFDRRKNVLGLTRQAAADLCKVGSQTLVRAENPDFNIDLDTLRAISKGLDIPLADLTGVDEESLRSEQYLRERVRLFSLIPYLDHSEVSKFLGMIEAELGLERSDDLPTSLKNVKSAR